MGQTLRPYQTDAVHAVFDAIDMGHNRILYTQATGCGKTTTFAELIRLFLEYHNYKVLVLAHRRELITQAYERIFEHCGLDEYQIGIELAENRAPSSAKVVVGSIQTVKGAHRLPNFIPDVIITDEAHRCGAASYHNTLKRFKTINPDVLYIGCSVGPDTRLCIRHSNGLIENLSIEDFAARYDVPQDKNAAVSGVEVQTIAENGDLKWSSVSHVWRFKNTKRTLEISTQLGRKLVVTDDHSVFSLDEQGKMQLVTSGNLKVGDYLITEPQLNTEVKNDTQIDVWRYCDPHKTRIGNIPLKYVMMATEGKPKLRYQSQRGVYGANLRLETALEMGLVPSEEHRLYTEGASGTWFPAVVPTSSIAWLIGYITGDGWATKHSIGLAIRNEHLPQILGLLNELPGKHGYSIRQYEGAANLKLNCSPLKQMLVHWYGDKSATSKRLPTEIFTWDDCSRKLIIEGLIGSDGSRIKPGWRNRAGIAYVTTSYQLTQDINYLLNTFGIVPSISVRKPSKRAPNQTSDTNAVSYRVFFSERGINQEWVGWRTSLTEKNKARIKDDTQSTVLKITDIREIENVPDVYDLSIPGVERYFAGNFLVHNTATAKRTDRKSLYAIKPDGSFVQLVNKKTKAVYDADPSETVFQTHCYEFSILDAIEGGWLVPIVGHTVQTATDLNDVETDTDGDFKDGQLQKAVDNAERTNLAISAWKEIADDRPTIVFCAGVEHAHHAADLWRQAGYTAVALDGETDSYDRAIALKDFRSGKIQVLCNMGLFTEGTDLPTCACVIHLRPTKSWNLFVQMSGRGSRVLPGVLEGIDDAEERKAAIAASNKKDCLIIDLVDICENNDLCTVPSILDLPANLDLEGQSVTAAKKLLDEFEEVKEQVIGECPTTYRQLQVRLEQVQLIRNSGAKSSADWKASEHGFRFGRTPVGYQTELERIGPNQFELIVRHGGKELLRKTGKPTEDFRAYLDNARVRAMRAIEEHKETTVKGTLARLTPKQVGCLRANGHTRDEIDRMTAGYAKVLIARYMSDWKERKEA